MSIYLSFLQVHGLLHLLGFDHEISEEAEEEMEKEEELLLKSLGWTGKGLIQSAYDAQPHVNSHMEISDGNLTFYQLKGFSIHLLGCFKLDVYIIHFITLTLFTEEITYV